MCEILSIYFKHWMSTYLSQMARKNKAQQFVDWCIFSINLDLNMKPIFIYIVIHLFLHRSWHWSWIFCLFIWRKHFIRKNQNVFVISTIYFYHDRNLIIYWRYFAIEKLNPLSCHTFFEWFTSYGKYFSLFCWNYNKKLFKIYSTVTLMLLPCAKEKKNSQIFSS